MTVDELAIALGTDILAIDGFDASGTGDVALTWGLGCLVQDLAHRYDTPLGGHWLDPEYGTDVFRFLQADLDAHALAGIEVAFEVATEADERVEPGTASARAELDAQAEDQLIVRIGCRPTFGSNPLNLVLGFDLTELSVKVLYAAA